MPAATLPCGPGLIGIAAAPAEWDPVAAWNAAAVITLAGAEEMDLPALAAAVRRRHMEWHHWPIQDYGVPDAAFEAAWPGRSAAIRSLLDCGGRVLIHCRAGLGRSGMVAARLLAEAGLDPAEAIATVRTARPGAIETEAQAAWVMAAHPTPLPLPMPLPGRDRAAASGRALGALLGLAAGDAVGAALEFTVKPRFAELDDMVAGGPHRLQLGQWTDDTAMALALADSLLHDSALDADDLMRRFSDWQQHGTYSCTGRCFDIGNATRAALDRFRRSGQAMAGSTADYASGNGALMRLAPVAIRHWRDRAELLRVTELQTRTTHGAPATLSTSRILAELLADAIAGAPLPAVLSSPAADQIEGGWRGLHRDQVEGSGYVVRSLQAALWAVSRTTSFRTAVLLAANLGDDADTTAAIAGQLAGAVYGIAGIPPDWLQPLAWRPRLQQTALALFDAGWPE